MIHPKDHTSHLGPKLPSQTSGAMVVGVPPIKRPAGSATENISATPKSMMTAWGVSHLSLVESFVPRAETGDLFFKYRQDSGWMVSFHLYDIYAQYIQYILKDSEACEGKENILYASIIFIYLYFRFGCFGGYPGFGKWAKLWTWCPWPSFVSQIMTCAEKQVNDNTSSRWNAHVPSRVSSG